MADHPTEAAVDTFELHQRTVDGSSSTGLAFWAPFALVSMSAFVLLTYVAAV